MRRCTRPDWSTEQYDYCACDSPNFGAALENGHDPCEDCRYSEVIEL